jgi:hypothetical protein
MRNHISFSQFCSAVLRKGGVAFFLAALYTVGLGFTASAQDHHFIIFEAPGADTTLGDNNGTYPSGVNNWGAITGSFQDSNNTFHGFLRSANGKFTTFQAPAADLGPYNGTSPAAINDLGMITGSYYDVNGFAHGFLRSPDGKFTVFNVPGVGGYGTAPLAINLEGAVVGWYTDSTYSFHAFLRSPDGTFTTWIGPDACTGNGSEGVLRDGSLPNQRIWNNCRGLSG